MPPKKKLPKKTLTNRGSVNVIFPIVDIENKLQLDYCDDTTDTRDKKHKTFNKKYIANEFSDFSRSVVKPSHELYMISFLGWTDSQHKDVVLLRRRDIKDLAKSPLIQDWDQTIYPVIVKAETEPIKYEKKEYGEYFKKYNWLKDVDFQYGPGSYLVLVEMEKLEEKREINIICSWNTDMKMVTMKVYNWYLYFYRVLRDKNEGSAKKFRGGYKIDRILDRQSDDQTVYDIFGMFAAGETYVDHFNNEQMHRQCYDHSFNQLYGNDRRFGFRTEPSHNWRSRRIGYFCSRNAMFVVREGPLKCFEGQKRSMTSLLRESTFLIVDGAHSYYPTSLTWKYKLVDSELIIQLGPLIVVITEGVSFVNVTELKGYPTLRASYYSVADNYYHPILLKWLIFEEDFSPNGATTDPYIKSQKIIKQIMTLDEFYDFVVFRIRRNLNMQNPSELQSNEIVFSLRTQPYFLALPGPRTLRMTDWHTYALLDDRHYYYLGTFTKKCMLEYGMFCEPELHFLDLSGIPFKLFAPEINYQEYPGLQTFENRRQLLADYWTLFSTDHRLVKGFQFYNDCIKHLKDIHQLRNPTVNIFMNGYKTVSVWNKLKVKNVDMRKNSQQNTLDTFRHYLKRFQCLKFEEFQDFLKFKIKIEINEVTYPMILAMADYPMVFVPNIPNRRTCEVDIVEFWDLYFLLSEDKVDRKQDLYYYLESIKIRYECRRQPDETMRYNFDRIYPMSYIVVVSDTQPIESIWYPSLDVQQMLHKIQEIFTIYEGIRASIRESAPAFLARDLTAPTFWSELRRQFIENPLDCEYASSWNDHFRKLSTGQ